MCTEIRHWIGLRRIGSKTTSDVLYQSANANAISIKELVNIVLHTKGEIKINCKRININIQLSQKIYHTNVKCK